MASRPATLALRPRSAWASTLHQSHRHQPRRHASVLFALSALSNSRETQHFNKATRLSRVEHSPALKLIKTSEVDPYPLPEQARRGAASVSGADEEEGVARSRRDDFSAGAGSPVAPSSSSNAGIPSSPSSGSGWASAAGTGSGGGGKKPRESESAMDEEDIEPDEPDERAEQDALKAGKAVILEHIHEKRKLRRRLKESKSQIKKLERDLVERKPYLGDDSPLPRFLAKSFFVAWVVTLALYFGELNSPSNAQRRAVDDATERKTRSQNAQHLGEMEELQKRAQEEAGRLREDNVCLRKKLMAVEDGASKHEAKNVDWTKKAEELKKAVEKKDASALTRSEQNAYLEALVFLKVKEKPEKRWWKGMFWSQG